MYNYPNYGNNQMYLQDLQNMRDRIDMQMRQMQQPQMPNQPANITQNFQLANAPSQNELGGKYVTGIDEVKSTLTLKDTLFIDKENKNLWIKRADGSIKAFALTEVIELDEKDKVIMSLQKEIEELKGAISNAKYVNECNDADVTKQKSTNVSNDKSSKK